MSVCDVYSFVGVHCVTIRTSLLMRPKSIEIQNNPQDEIRSKHIFPVRCETKCDYKQAFILECWTFGPLLKSDACERCVVDVFRACRSPVRTADTGHDSALRLRRSFSSSNYVRTMYEDSFRSRKSSWRNSHRYARNTKLPLFVRLCRMH